MIKRLTLCLLLSTRFVSGYAQQIELTSPSGNIQVIVQNKDQLSYRILMDGKVMITDSPLGFKFSHEPDMGTDLLLTGQKEQEIKESWVPVIKSKHAAINNHYQSIQLFFIEKDGLRRKMDMELRAYDDGIAFRYHMCFFRNPIHLFDGVDQGGIVLTPHWGPLFPTPNLGKFRDNYLYGLFNAGCITANAKGIPALNWWAQACMTGIEIDLAKGLMLDQRYLDLMYIHFPETVICRHLGYNMADWNVEIRNDYLKRGENIKDTFPVVLVHFTGPTVARIENGGDKTLEPYLLIYKQYLQLSERMLADIQGETNVI